MGEDGGGVGREQVINRNATLNKLEKRESRTTELRRGLREELNKHDAIHEKAWDKQNRE
jgi:hypothetical protein